MKNLSRMTRAVLFCPGLDEELLCEIKDMSVDVSTGRPVEIKNTMYLFPNQSIDPLYWRPDTSKYRQTLPNLSLKARKVIFNPPATIILWEDGTKTVVKCDDEDYYEPATGVALCYMKKALGNTSRDLNKALRKAMETITWLNS